MRAIPPLRYYLERVLRDIAGISHWAAKGVKQLRPDSVQSDEKNPGKIRLKSGRDPSEACVCRGTRRTLTGPKGKISFPTSQKLREAKFFIYPSSQRSEL